MTSSTALAHSSQAAAPAFNADFYVAAATVIPVLFLAIAVQGPTYTSILRVISGEATLGEQDGKPGLLGLTSASTIGLAALLPAMLIPFSGVVGEIMALMTLDAGHAEGDQTVVLVAAVFLTIAAALGPAAAFWNALSSQEAGTSPQRPGQETGPTSPAETGKPPD